MNWKKYELEILNYFTDLYPDTLITFDKKIIGKFSKVERQIDIYLEGQIAGYQIKIAVDCKYFSKNIDVKHVESFCSMVEDIDAHQGVLITKKGFSKAAINRAYYGIQKVELDILNFEEITKYQSLSAFPYVGNMSISIKAPFGWILDIENPVNNFASLFQRGLTLKQAKKRNEWMYVQFWKKENSGFTIDNLIDIQNGYISEGTKAKFEYIIGPKRKDEISTKIRVADVDTYPSLEVTGFMNFERFIFYFVLFTPRELLNKNLRKLQYLLATTIPMEISFNNNQVIQSTLNDLEDIEDLEERAGKYNQIALWYKEMKDVENTFLYYQKALDSFPKHYFTLRMITFECLIHNKIEEAKKYAVITFELEPSNPKVIQELIELYLEVQKPNLLIKLLNSLLNEHKEVEVSGNINYHLGILLKKLDRLKEGTNHLNLAKENFKKVFKGDHIVFANLEKMLKD